ncbi:MAG: transposase [Lachnospiraceae bacterium]|nr:transposase [Lachnospiraceae bacterium]
MPRKPRIMSSTGIYHIILRSVNQHIIFEEESDYQKFLFILSDCKKKYDSDIFAYCLMDNHIHLLLRTDNDKLSSFFQSLGTRFVRWYNSKYSRSGHLFQDRFYSSVMENDSAFLSALVYIHNNPVKANMCRYASEYRWSSINAFYGEKNPLVNVSFSYDITGTKDSLLQFFARENNPSEDDMFKNDHRKINHFLTDEKALEIFKSVSHLTSISDVSNLGKTQRNLYVRSLRANGLTIKQTARIMDISETTVKRICRMTL